jgi:hypothetical protein
VNTEIATLWQTLSALYPMPMSQTRNRICGYVHDVKELGLINEAETQALLDSDERWREAEWARRQKEEAR